MVIHVQACLPYFALMGVFLHNNSKINKDFPCMNLHEYQAKQLFGALLVPHRSGPGGQPVEKLLIEMPCHIARELYLACLVDRTRERVVVMASTEGGMDIGGVAGRTPEKILKAFVDHVAGLQSYQCRELAFALGF